MLHHYHSYLMIRNRITPHPVPDGCISCNKLSNFCVPPSGPCQQIKMIMWSITCTNPISNTQSIIPLRKMCVWIIFSSIMSFQFYTSRSRSTMFHFDPLFFLKVFCGSWGRVRPVEKLQNVFFRVHCVHWKCIFILVNVLHHESKLRTTSVLLQ